MKKNDLRLFVPLIASVLVLGGCDFEKNFLTVEQIGKATTATFFSEVDGLVAAGEGLHAQLRDFIDDDYLKYGDIRGDLLYSTADANEGQILTYDYELTAEHVATFPRLLWTAGWAIVTEANNILYYGPILRESGKSIQSSDKAKIDKILAQAHFARAFAHFCICNCYAWPYGHTSDHSHLGIPVMDHLPSFNEKVDRKSVKDVYELILSDLSESRRLFKQAAEENPATADAECQINSIKDCYHISDIACEALLARVYLYMEDWDNAARCAKNVMDKVPLSPYADYVKMYRNSQDNHGAESILRMNGYNNTSSMAGFYDIPRSPSFIPDDSVYDMFNDDDIRKTLLTYIPLPKEDIYKPGLTFKGVCKYSYDRNITDPYKQVCDNFVLRASEMYLIHAEAVVKGEDNTSAAEADLKALIARARNISASAVTLDYSGTGGLLSLIELERKRELCFEGHRFFDIIRQKQNLSRSPANNSRMKSLAYPDYRFLMPIDRMECQYNEFIQQNDGYDDYK